MQFKDESSPDDLGFCLSFSCYFSDNNNSIASAAAKVICELKQESQARFYEFSDVDEEEFQFSPDPSDEQVSAKHIDDFEFIFPVFDRVVQELGDAASPVSNNQLQKSTGNEQESYSSSSSFSSSEVADANDCNCKPSRIFCMWMPNTEVMSSVIAKCKKISSSAGNISGSRRWRIWNTFRRINSEGDESVLFLRSSKKTDHASKERPKQKLVMTASPSFHEVFYVQKRAEQKGDKMKSFLPYKQDLLGFFVKINRLGNKKLSS